MGSIGMVYVQRVDQANLYLLDSLWLVFPIPEKVPRMLGQIPGIKIVPLIWLVMTHMFGQFHFCYLRDKKLVGRKYEAKISLN